MASSSSSSERSFSVAATATVAKTPILAAYDATAIETEVFFSNKLLFISCIGN